MRALGAGARGGHPADDTFSALLDPELEKIVRFYREQEAELLRELQQLEADIAQLDVSEPGAGTPYGYFDEDEEDEEYLSPNSGLSFFLFFCSFAVVRSLHLHPDTRSSYAAGYESLALARLDE